MHIVPYFKINQIIQLNLLFKLISYDQPCDLSHMDILVIPDEPFIGSIYLDSFTIHAN